jgi:selenocysteine-specific elongation factor
VEAYHRSHPLRPGFPREEVAPRLGLKPKSSNAFVNALDAEGLVAAGESWVARPGWTITLSAAQQKAVDSLLGQFEAAPFTPPNAGEAIALVGEELLAYLIAAGTLVRVSPEVLLARDGYEAMVTGVHELFAEQGEVTAGALRDRFSTSRKYAIALLEHLDTLKVTRRVGDSRLLR